MVTWWELCKESARIGRGAPVRARTDRRGRNTKCSVVNTKGDGGAAGCSAERPGPEGLWAGCGWWEVVVVVMLRAKAAAGESLGGVAPS